MFAGHGTHSCMHARHPASLPPSERGLPLRGHQLPWDHRCPRCRLCCCCWRCQCRCWGCSHLESSSSNSPEGLSSTGMTIKSIITKPRSMSGDESSHMSCILCPTNWFGSLRPSDSNFWSDTETDRLLSSIHRLHIHVAAMSRESEPERC